MADEQSPNKLPRLDATATLSKPFKSPLRNRVPSGSPCLTSDSTSTEKSGEQNTSSPPATNGNSSRNGKLPVLSSNVTQRHPLHLRRNAFSRPFVADPELLRLQKKKRSLQTRLKVLAEEMDCLNQAIKIESSSKDAELEALIVKWRRIGQDAADEALNIAKERIARMGGMAAWRESTQRAMQWDAEENNLDDGSEHGGDINDETPQTDQAALLNKEGQEDELTMETMLKTQNIDLQLIGFDPFTDSWIRDKVQKS